MVRTVQPVLRDWDTEYEHAALSLGANRWTILRRVIFPEIFPAWLSGLALAFARALGEYGSVIFIAGNIPGKSQIAPLQIVTKLDDFRYAQATAIGVVLLFFSLLTLLRDQRPRMVDATPRNQHLRITTRLPLHRRIFEIRTGYGRSTAQEVWSSRRPESRLRRPSRSSAGSLIATTVGFLTLFIVLPVVNVFAQAFSKGIDAYVSVFHAESPPEGAPLSLPERRKLAVGPRSGRQDLEFDQTDHRHCARSSFRSTLSSGSRPLGRSRNSGSGDVPF